MGSSVLVPFAIVGLAWTCVAIWRHCWGEYLVVSMNSEMGIRVHTVPVPYTRAMSRLRALQYQLTCQRNSGFPVARSVFLLPFDKTWEVRV
jgi:hypothetical protein